MSLARKLTRAPYNALRYLTQPWRTAVALLNPQVGRDYGVGLGHKLRLLRRMWRNSHHPGSACPRPVCRWCAPSPGGG